MAEGQEQYNAVIVQGRDARTLAEFRFAFKSSEIGWGAELARSMGVAERARKALEGQG